MDESVSPATTDTFYRQDVSRCLADGIGPHGISNEALARAKDRVGDALARLQQQYNDNSLPLLKITRERDDLDRALAALHRLSENARTIVFFGTGGSGLGGQTLAQVSGWNIPGGANVYDRSRPRTRFYDNLDPLTQLGALDPTDLADIRFVVISKSGGTAETLAQAVTALSAVQEAGLGDKIPQMFLAITEPRQTGKANGLRDLCDSLSIPTLNHHTGIGGRFSCLTNVGLIPAAARGLDVFGIRHGADMVVQEMSVASEAADCPPALGAVVALAAAEEHAISNTVMLPYSDRLARFADWFVQLWAESLGKGGRGTIPMATLGPRDQHSQLQLFMDGPRSFLFTVLRIANTGTGPKVDHALAERAGADYMAGRTIGDIVHAQSHAIVEALAQAGRPVRTIDIATLGNEQIGALLMHFMLETILMGYAIGVDPFDQPAVELAKKLTRENLKSSGL